MRLAIYLFAASIAGCASTVVPEYPDGDAVSRDVVAPDGQPAIDLTGRWNIEHDVLPGGEWPGMYAGILELRETNGRLDGVVTSWSEARTGSPNDSRFTGTRTGLHIEMDRHDVGSSAGFRAHFTGEVDPSGNRMTGTFANDPTSPFGNSDHGPWHAERLMP